LRILVTGSAGFIGFHLIRSLLKLDNISVVGIDSINDYYDINLKYSRLNELGIKRSGILYNSVVESLDFLDFSFLQINLEDRSAILDLFTNYKFDIVIHLAAQAGVRYSISKPYKYIDSNIVGFINILESCRHNDVSHLVYASSSSVYGLNIEVPFKVEHKINQPVSLYAATKISNELMAHSYSHLFKIRTTGLRFFTVYGPWGRPDMAYYSFTQSIISGKTIDVYNNGNMSRDFTYIDDIVNGLTKVALKKYTTIDDLYNIYNIGSSSPISLLKFIETIENVLGKEAKKIFLPMQPGDVEKTYADIQPLVENFDFKPATSLLAGVKKFVDWYLSYYNT